MSREKVLRRVTGLARLEADEPVVAWSHAWVSRAGRWNRVVAARVRDVVLVTDRRVMLFSIGFFTRRPRRRVLADRLYDITVRDTGRSSGRRLLVERSAGPSIVIELGRREPDRAVAAALLGRDCDRGTEPADPPEPQHAR